MCDLLLRALFDGLHLQYLHDFVGQGSSWFKNRERSYCFVGMEKFLRGVVANFSIMSVMSHFKNRINIINPMETVTT